MVNSRRKGKVGELKLSHALNDLGFNTRRGQQYCGSNGDADVVGIPNLHIECKTVEHLDLYAAMEQSKHDALAFEIPVVMHKKNNKQWLVTMELKDWVTLWQKQ